jgi:uncharacterized protein DUF4440
MNTRNAAMVIVLTLCSSTLVAQAKPPAASKARVPSAMMAPVDRERSIFVALEKNDIAAFNEAIGSDFMYVSGDGVQKWELAKSADVLKGCKTGKLTMSDVTSTPQGDDLMVITYKVAGEQVCNGKKGPSPINALSVWRKMGGRWVAVAHSETPAVPAAPAAKK